MLTEQDIITGNGVFCTRDELTRPHQKQFEPAGCICYVDLWLGLHSVGCNTDVNAGRTFVASRIICMLNSILNIAC